MTKMRALALALVVVLSACTPQQIALLHFFNRPPDSGTPCAEWAGAFRLAGFHDGYELDHMLSLVHRESRCNPAAVSPTHDYGLAQINWAAHHEWLLQIGWITSRGDLLNPQTNATIAHELYEMDGWSPWAKR